MTHPTQILQKCKSGSVEIDRVKFNARKTQCCLLSHKRISDAGLNVCMGGMEIAKSETLDVLGTSIRSDLSWAHSIS